MTPASPESCTNGKKAFRIGLLVPASGTAGIWGPSCRASAELAITEINRHWSHPAEIRFVDAGAAPTVVADNTTRLVQAKQIDAIVGMHTSDVRDAVAARIGRQVPYIYTPLHEGRAPDNAICIGATPDRQLVPALDWMLQRFRLRRWFFLGNDYVWPRTTHDIAGRRITLDGAKVVGSRYLPMNCPDTRAGDYAEILEDIRAAKPDALFLSLIGQDSVLFNRAFHKAGFARTILRFSCAIEENMLLAIGGHATEGIFVSAGYFSTLDTKSNGAFRERYHSHFSDRAPVLNDLGQSVYEGMSCLARQIFRCEDVATSARRSPGDPTGGIYLAEAQGFGFEIVSHLAR